MSLKDKRIAFVLSGSFHTFKIIKKQIKNIIKDGAEVIPIMTDNAYTLNTKFGKAKEHIEEIEQATKRKIIHTIEEAEQIGNKILTDILIVAPCTRKYDC